MGVSRKTGNYSLCSTPNLTPNVPHTCEKKKTKGGTERCSVKIVIPNFLKYKALT